MEGGFGGMGGMVRLIDWDFTCMRQGEFYLGGSVAVLGVGVAGCANWY